MRMFYVVGWSKPQNVTLLAAIHFHHLETSHSETPPQNKVHEVFTFHPCYKTLAQIVLISQLLVGKLIFHLTSEVFGPHPHRGTPKERHTVKVRNATKEDKKLKEAAFRPTFDQEGFRIRKLVK